MKSESFFLNEKKSVTSRRRRRPRAFIKAI